MANLSSISQDNGKAKNSERNPDEIVRMVEEELARHRAKWQRLSARKNTFRAVSLLFLMAMIGAVFIALFYYFTMDHAHDLRPEQINQPTSVSPIKR